MGWRVEIEERPTFRAVCFEPHCVWVSTFGSRTAAEHAVRAHIKRHEVELADSRRPIRIEKTP